MDDDFFQRRVGTVLCGKWTLERLLGVGGMAAVYVGMHRIGHRDAIKILHPTAGRSKELRARFEQEARAVARLGHPGAVRIDDIDTAEDGSLFLVMELLEGETLAERATRAGCPALDEALGWADALLDVLAAAHALGIIHRDIKPDNVFLTTDGRVKLLDFGIARMRDVQNESLHTATGVALGTLPFMPPEQVRGLVVDPRADLFALAATVVRLLAGRHLHVASNDAELMLKMATEPAPPVKTLMPALSPDVCAVLDRALSFDRERRHPDAATMQADVRALREGRPLPAAPAVVGGTPAATSAFAPMATARAARAPERAPRLLWVLGASILAGCFATGAILWAVTGGDAAVAAEAHGDAVLAAGDVQGPTDAPAALNTAAAPGRVIPPATSRADTPARPVPTASGRTPAPPAGPPPATSPGAAPAQPPRPPPRQHDDDDPPGRGKEKKEKDRGKKGKGKGHD